MGRIKADFAAADREQQIRYCANLIEESAAAGDSDRRIREKLAKLGADEEVVSLAFQRLEGSELPTEAERALAAARRLMEKSKDPGSAANLRKILNKLAYLGFEEEIIYETAEKLGREYDLGDIFS